MKEEMGFESHQGKEKTLIFSTMTLTKLEETEKEVC
jgi:hypothetical protein